MLPIMESREEYELDVPSYKDHSGKKWDENFNSTVVEVVNELHEVWLLVGTGLAIVG